MPKRPTLPNTAPAPEKRSTPTTAPTAKTSRNAKASGAKQPRTSTPKPTTHTVAPVMSTPSGTGRWLRGIHFSAFSLVMMGILVLAVVILAPTLQAFAQQRSQIADQQAVVDTLNSQVDAAKAQRARWNDPSYIRAQARDRLYYVMPGETSYLVIDDRPPAAASTDAPVSSKIQQTHTDWAGSLFGSFMGAGLTEATPAQLSGQTGTPAPTPTPSK
ncbi:FtsB family cell division protein [Leifsonia aquatica]|uniref:FtsB family cell division protein n=1 Tax=Leifsonia aquatica TaxID=144185 RepID=UPI0028A7641A|nr:septum formation initiator family protein [Leifsonia aquatica]